MDNVVQIKLRRVSQKKNQRGSHIYVVPDDQMNLLPENTPIYGRNNNLIYANAEVGVYNQLVDVTLIVNETKNKMNKTAFYCVISVDKEMDKLTKRGHTSKLVKKAGLDKESIEGLVALSVLDKAEAEAQKAIAEAETARKANNTTANTTAGSKTTNTVVDDPDAQPSTEDVPSEEENPALNTETNGEKPEEGSNEKPAEEPEKVAETATVETTPKPPAKPKAEGKN